MSSLPCFHLPGNSSPPALPPLLIWPSKKWKRKKVHPLKIWEIEEEFKIPPSPLTNMNPTNNGPLINFLLSSDAKILLLSTDWAYKSAPKRVKTCVQCVHIPAELPLCIPPLVVGKEIVSALFFPSRISGVTSSPASQSPPLSPSLKRHRGEIWGGHLLRGGGGGGGKKSSLFFSRDENYQTEKREEMKVCEIAINYDFFLSPHFSNFGQQKTFAELIIPSQKKKRAKNANFLLCLSGNYSIFFSCRRRWQKLWTYVYFPYNTVREFPFIARVGGRGCTHKKEIPFPDWLFLPAAG